MSKNFNASNFAEHTLLLHWKQIPRQYRHAPMLENSLSIVRQKFSIWLTPNPSYPSISVGLLERPTNETVFSHLMQSYKIYLGNFAKDNVPIAS